MANQPQQPDTALHNASHLMQYHDLIESIVAALDARDAYTASHSDRVADMVLVLAAALGLDEDETTRIHMAAHLHDIGKIGIEDDFAPHFEKFKRAVEIAKKLHTTRIRMFSFYIPEGKNPEIYHDTVIERIQKMVDYGEANGVHCCHENEKGIYGDTLERVEKLHKAIPALRCVFDPANYIQCGNDPAVNFKALAPIIDYMHIKDALFKDGSVVPAGEGDGSVPSILKALAETGKPYMLTLEPHLYDFSGLQNLQGEDVLHKRVYKDADEAFDVASDALHDILKTIE